MMGPSAFHTDQVELRSRIAALPERMEPRAALVLSVWRRSAQAA